MRTEKENIGTTPDEKLKGLLSALPRIEPPGDFDVRVRARIAANGETRRASGPLLWAKLAVPALALVALGAVFFGGIYRENNSDQAQIPTVEVPRMVAPAEPREEVAVQVPQEAPAEIKEEVPAETVAVKETGRNRQQSADVRRPRAATPIAEEEGGAFEEAGRAGSHILPRGFEVVDEPQPDPDAPPVATSVSVADILSILGVQAERSSAGWIARSIRDGSVAQKSGLLAGDIIEAIDDMEIKTVTEMKGRFDGGSLRVNRAGKTVRLNISPK